MNRITIRCVAELQPQIETVLSAELPRLHRLIPENAVEHVGATAISGAVTNGDEDVALRVTAPEFGRVVAALSSAYEITQPENWTPEYASLKDDTTGPLPFGVQAVVIGSGNDPFLNLRNLLTRYPTALARYNAVKVRNDGEENRVYWREKGRVIEELLAGQAQESRPR